MLTRVEVEGGFLHGLSLRLEPGLNAVIGARGTGKTSVIELVRFCLGLSSYTSSVRRRASDHARSVLGNGEVRVSFVDTDGDEHYVSRSAEDEAPRFSAVARPRPVIVLAQNEIERVGLDKVGRLALVDGFATTIRSVQTREEHTLASIASITQQISGVVAAIRELEAGMEHARALEASLAESEATAMASPGDAELAAIRGQLRSLDEVTARKRDQLRVLERVVSDVEGWADDIGDLVDVAPGETTWPDAPTLEMSLEDTAARLRSAVATLERARATALSSVEDLNKAAGRLRDEIPKLDERTRALRAELETRQQGAGRQAQLLSRLAQVRSELESTRAVTEARHMEARALQKSRTQLLDDLDQLRSVRFRARRDAAALLNERLGPAVHVEVKRLGLYDEYAGAIASSLRGSGIQYSKLAGEIAERMTPRELCEAVELGDPAAIESAVGITRDRAGRLVDALRDAGTHDIIQAPLEDAVELFLLDGGDYKRTDELSTGQRCTVVLPILLCHTDVTILIDQPEDHLDNAFIVETVVATLRDRGGSSQFVFATHNANIPVIGNADRVTLMASDGRRGFVRTSDTLDAPATREAISRVMEGGEEAFATRAAFYATG